MSKFEIPTEDALECALQSHGIGGDFLREVATAIDDDRKVVINGKRLRSSRLMATRSGAWRSFSRLRRVIHAQWLPIRF